MATEVQYQNRHIIAAFSISALYIATMKLTDIHLSNFINWVFAMAAIYIALIGYGIFSLVRIITTRQKRTLRYCMPFIIIAIVLLLNFGAVLLSHSSSS